MRGLTPKLTGAGARSAQGTGAGHENAEGMASFGVHVERPVRLVHRCAVMQVHGNFVRFEYPQSSNKLRVRVEPTVRLGRVGTVVHLHCLTYEARYDSLL